MSGRPRLASQHAADETHKSFDHRFYPTAQNHFLSVNSRSSMDPGWLYTSEGETFQTRGVLHRHRSDYRKYLPGQFIRIRLKIEQNCHLFLDIFSSAIMNDLFTTFTSRLKVDAKCVYQQWNWITVANYFGTPPADWVHGYLYFKPGAWIWTKGFRRYLHIVKNWSRIFSLNSSRARALGWPLLGNFSGFFWFFWGGSVGQIIYREYIVFRGSNISCSLTTWCCVNI